MIRAFRSLSISVNRFACEVDDPATTLVPGRPSFGASPDDCWLSLVRAPVRVVYEAGSPGGCSGGAGSCDPTQIRVHVGARGAGCSPDGVGG
jgi:hypothetical protein